MTQLLKISARPQYMRPVDHIMAIVVIVATEHDIDQPAACQLRQLLIIRLALMRHCNDDLGSLLFQTGYKFMCSL